MISLTRFQLRNFAICHRRLASARKTAEASSTANAREQTRIASREKTKSENKGMGSFGNVEKDVNWMPGGFQDLW